MFDTKAAIKRLNRLDKAIAAITPPTASMTTTAPHLAGRYARWDFQDDTDYTLFAAVTVTTDIFGGVKKIEATWPNRAQVQAGEVQYTRLAALMVAAGKAITLIEKEFGCD